MRKVFLLLLATLIALTSCSSTIDENTITVLLSAKDTGDETYRSTEEAYSRYPDDIRVAYNWAYILLSNGEMDRCIEVCDAAIVNFPTSLRFYYLRCAAIYSQGRHQSYLAALEEILSFDPANTDVMLTIADYHISHFHSERATVWAERVLSYDKTNSRALSIMALTDDFYASIASPPAADEIYTNEWQKTIALPDDDINSALEVFSRRDEERPLLFQPLNVEETEAEDTPTS